MKRVILRYGLASGLVCAALMSATMPFADKIGHSMVVGYTTMVLSFLLVFFGIRSYRENEGGGAITFGKALAVGMGIAMIMCVFYVATWEVLYYNFMPDFLDKYSASVMAKMKASGATAQEIQKQTDMMATYRKMYGNPVTLGLVTIIEPLPVAIVFSLISAAMLRKPKAQVAVATV